MTTSSLGDPALKYHLVAWRGTGPAHTPDWNGSAYINLEYPVARFGDAVYARLQWFYQGDAVNMFEPIPTDGSSAHPQLKTGSYDAVTLTIGLRATPGMFRCFVNNITDELATTDIVGCGDWGSANRAEGRRTHTDQFRIRPREFGIRFVKRWGG